MIYTLKHSLDQESLWNLFTTDDFMVQWLAEKSDINWRKNGKIKLTITSGTHEISGCKIIEFKPFEKISFTWKGPDDFDITMNFEDYLTSVEVTITDTTLTIEHKGWRSSEDWQEAKNWHEQVFWPEKIAKLKTLLETK